MFFFSEFCKGKRKIDVVSFLENPSNYALPRGGGIYGSALVRPSLTKDNIFFFCFIYFPFSMNFSFIFMFFSFSAQMYHTALLFSLFSLPTSTQKQGITVTTWGVHAYVSECSVYTSLSQVRCSAVAGRYLSPLTLSFN